MPSSTLSPILLVPYSFLPKRRWISSIGDDLRQRSYILAPNFFDSISSKMTDTKKLLNSPNNMGFEDKITAAVVGRFLSQAKGEVDMFDDKTIDDKITTE